MNNTNKEKKYSIVKAFFKLLPSVFGSAPLSFSVAQCVMGMYGIILGVTTIVTQRFFDTAANFVNKTTSLQSVIIMLIVLGLTHIVSQVLNGASFIMLETLVQKVSGKLSIKVHNKMCKLSPANFEDTQLLDNINKAEQGKSNTVWFILSIFLTLTYYTPYYTIMAVYLSSVKPIMALSVLLVFLPTLISQFLHAKVFSKLEDKTAPIRREFGYYEGCMTSREYYKETRILGAFTFFKKLYLDCLVLLNKLSFRASIKSTLIDLGMKLLSLGGYLGILFMLFTSLINGEVSVGMFAAVFASIGFMFSFMGELIGGHFGGIARNFGTVQNYLYFMELPEREGVDIDLKLDKNISLNNVSFTYPGTEKKAVDDVSLAIKAGETVAVVGENGSGKTTLVRLITGLYLPDDGTVLYGEIDTKTVSTHSLFQHISAVFQKYQRYQMTLRENINISDVEKMVDDTVLDTVCSNAGVDKNGNSLTNSYDTMLSREFDGVDLSGGQWQRVAIARSFFRSHHIIILDEPTAAIDPLEETKIYNHFAEISKTKTAIIVTHRLGSVKLADRILVMKEGKLVEQGTHAELISVNGEYARLYMAQEQWYKV